MSRTITTHVYERKSSLTDVQAAFDALIEKCMLSARTKSHKIFLVLYVSPLVDVHRLHILKIVTDTAHFSI
jgi:hypothetical protein